MKETEISERQRVIADFRFGLIADLVYSHAQGVELSRAIAAKAATEWTIPYSRKKTLTVSCIKKWLKAYRMQGKEALIPKIRKDTGRCKVLTEQEKVSILELLEQKPYLCASVAVRMLQKEGKITSEVSKSALSRFIMASGLTRRERVRESKTDQVLRYSFDQPLECVQVDAMHSFAVPDASGHLRKAILVAFLDDATRRVVYARFCFSENALEFERGLHHILRSHGRIRRVYTDNGSTFVAEQTKMILSALGIPLMHSRPGIPKGRGKIERFFRTVRTQFEATIDPSTIKSIQDYDMRFHTWLESEYHRSGHSGLGGQTPLEAWLAGSRHIFRMDATIDLDEAFCHQLYRSVSNDATISLDGTRYEVPSVLIGRKVKVRFNPLNDTLVIRVFYDGKEYGHARLIDEYGNARSRRIMAADTPAQTVLRSSAALGSPL
jgi:transposase InsO family protein